MKGLMEYLLRNRCIDVLRFMWDKTGEPSSFSSRCDDYTFFNDIGHVFYSVLKKKVESYIVGDGKEEEINDLIGGPGRLSGERKGALEDDVRRVNHSIDFDFGSGVVDDEGFVQVVFVFLRAETHGHKAWGESGVIKVPASWRETNERLFQDIPRGAKVPSMLLYDIYESTIRFTAKRASFVFAHSVG